MNIGEIDARLVTACCLWIIGALIWWRVIALWMMHPINRAFALGPYYTEAGMTRIIKALPLMFMLGATVIATGFSRLAYWLWSQNIVSAEYAAVAGFVEAAFSGWVAGALILIVTKEVLSWRNRRRT